MLKAFCRKSEGLHRGGKADDTGKRKETDDFLASRLPRAWNETVVVSRISLQRLLLTYLLTFMLFITE
jgi:hypothetical protein